jgi:glutathione synthase/RimK-type ligase-like ATP-grasp enzyme
VATALQISPTLRWLIESFPRSLGSFAVSIAASFEAEVSVSESGVVKKRVGILVGRERSFPDALIAEVLRRDEGVVADYARIDITHIDAPPAYDVLVDRISHDIPFYQPVLKLAALNGTHVINNPFWRIADDKLFNAALAKELGVAVPKTAVLPAKAYGDDVSQESLKNLAYPLDWEGLVRDYGFPMFIKPHWGGGFRDVSRADNMDELMRAYDKSQKLTMIVQEGIEWVQYVRCIVIGQTEVLPALWDPRLGHFERYTRAGETMAPLEKKLEERVVRDAIKLCAALGYEMNTVEFAIRDSIPYAIDFMNSAPDFDRSSLGPEQFSWVIEKMTDLVIDRAKSPPKKSDLWSEHLRR